MPWIDGMPAEDLGYVQNKGWDKLDGDGAAKAVLASYRQLEKLHGVPPEKVIRIPDEMTPETLKPIFERLGVPATPDKYDFSVLKDHEGKDLTPEIVASLRGLAAAGGMTQAGAAKFAADYLKHQGETGAAAKAAADAAAARTTTEATEKAVQTKAANEAALKAEWVGTYDVNNLAAQRMAAMLGFTAEDVATMQGTDKYVPFMQRMHAMVKASGETQMLTGQQPGAVGGQTLEQLQARKDEIMAANRNKMLRGEEAEKVFKEMAEIDRQMVALRHGRK